MKPTTRDSRRENAAARDHRDLTRNPATREPTGPEPPVTEPTVRTRPGVIAVFGGTFDPPHWGHVRAAEAVRDRLGVEAVWLVPAAVPPHRPVPPRLPAADRLQLVARAVAGRPRLVASGLELEREGPSFTLDTLDRLAESRPAPPGGGPSCLLAVGSDAFRDLRTWSRWERLLTRHPVLILQRRGYPLEEALAPLPPRFRAGATRDLAGPLAPPRLLLMDLPLPDPASEDIRSRLDAALPIGDLVPPGVAETIESRSLYR